MSFPRYESYKDSGVEWLGEVPEHWDVKKLKSILAIKKELVGSKFDEFTLLSLTLQGVVPRDLDNPQGKFPAEFNTYQQVVKNDIIFCLFDVEETPRAVGFSELHGMLTGAYTVTSLINQDFSAKYFYYFYLSRDQYKAFKMFYTGLRNVIRKETFNAINFPVPSIREQKQIAHFLDQETAKIDNLIAEQERLIALLKEKRQAVISHAVTKGLNPDVPMKDSGVEWLGEVPEHWDVKRLKHIKSNQANAFVDGPFGSNLKSEHFIENGDAYVIESNFATQGKLNLDELKTISSSHFLNIQRSEVKETDLVIAKIGAQFGKVSILPYIDKPAVVSGNSMKLTVSEDICGIKWAYLQLQNLKEIGEMELLVNGSAQPALSLSGMNQLIFLLPPKNEQSIIIDKVEAETAKMDSLIAESINVISLLKERRSALISSAVTGKIDIRTYKNGGQDGQV